MRVDTFTFYIHCRLHLMPAAVIFYAIGRAFVGHREDRFPVAPTIFSLSLWRRTLPAHRLLHLHMYDSVDSANKSAMCRWQYIHKPGLYTLHNYLNINRIQTKVQSALKSRISMSTSSLSAYSLQNWPLSPSYPTFLLITFVANTFPNNIWPQTSPPYTISSCSTHLPQCWLLHFAL